MNRFIILLILTSTFLFSATFPSAFYPTTNLVSESSSEKNIFPSSKNNLQSNSEKEGKKDNKEQIQKKKKNKFRPFQTLRQITQLKKALKESKKNYKANFPKIAKNKKDDGDCDIPANKLDWRVWVALGCVVAMLVLPIFASIALSFAFNATTSFVLLEAISALSFALSPILGLIGFFVGLRQLKKYSYKNDCENYAANRRNRTGALVATILGGIIFGVFLLSIFLLIISLLLFAL